MIWFFCCVVVFFFFFCFFVFYFFFFFFSSRRRHTRSYGDWSSDVCSSDLGVGAADVDAARERDLAVDNQDLAVVAIVELPAPGGLRRVDRVEFADRNAGPPQGVEVLARRLDRADAVVEHVDLHTLRDLACQERREPLSDLAALQDVGLQVDMVAR